MKKYLLFSLLLFSAVYLFSQPYTIGTQTITYTDAARSNRSVGVEFHYPGTNSAVASGQFPFVIFGHGFQMDQVPYYPYADTLAKLGYVVGLLTTETALLPSHPNFAQDLIFVYNQLISEGNANASSPFYQKVIAKGAIGGHSMGGGSTVLSCQYSNAAACYFTFAAANTNPSSISAAPFMTKPYLAFAGSRDCIAPIATNQKPMFDSSASPCKFLINITDGLHCQFGSGNVQCNFGEGFSGCAASPLSRSDQINKSLSFLVPFLDFYLKGDCSAWALFEVRYAANTDVMYRSCTPNLPPDAQITTDGTFLFASPTGNNYTYQWYLDNQPIALANSDTLIPAVSGSYSVLVTDANNCSDTADYNFALTGIENDIEPAFTIYPNPVATDEIYLLAKDEWLGEKVSITDVAGKEIIALSITAPNQKIQVGSLSKGTYIACIQAAKKISRQLLVVE